MAFFIPGKTINDNKKKRCSSCHEQKVVRFVFVDGFCCQLCRDCEPMTVNEAAEKANEGGTIQASDEVTNV